MPGKVRRIVTGVNDAGRSCILSDTRLPTADVAPGEPVRAGLWTTDASPVSNTGAADPVPEWVFVEICERGWAGKDRGRDPSRRRRGSGVLCGRVTSWRLAPLRRS